MSVKAVVPRALARRDVDEAIMEKQESTMGIIVDWTKSASPGMEYIDDVDLDNPEGCPDKMQTKFWYPEKGEFTRWKIEVRVEPPTDDGAVFVVKYEKEKRSMFVTLSL